MLVTPQMVRTPPKMSHRTPPVQPLDDVTLCNGSGATCDRMPREPLSGYWWLTAKSLLIDVDSYTMSVLGMLAHLQESNTVWLDPKISSGILIGKFCVTNLYHPYLRAEMRRKGSQWHQMQQSPNFEGKEQGLCLP